MAQDDPPRGEDDKTAWAEMRTDLAEDRNIMAMERTFAGWMRTSFAAIGIGLAFRAIFGELEPPWLGRAIATMFILSGGALAFAAQRRACRTVDRLHSHKMDRAESPNYRLLGYAVVLGSLLLTAGLWFLHDGDLGGLSRTG